MPRFIAQRSIRPVLLAVFALLVVGAPAQAAFPGANGKIAFERPALGDIWTMKPDGTGQTNITNNPAQDIGPAWSPDGTKIAFYSRRDGNYEIYTMNPDGTAPTNVTNTSPVDEYPSWSPDGTKIAFNSFRDGNGEIYTMNADGTGVARITNNAVNDAQPRWSPDGTKIAFTKELIVDEESTTLEIFTMNPDGTGETNITNNSSVIPIPEDFAPAWSPDGTKIAFFSNRDGNWEIYTMNADGSGIMRLTNNPTYDIEPAWSPDGTKIAFNRGDGIYTMNPDGTGVAGIGVGASPDWQPIPYTGYARPKAASPFNAALVIAYKNCTTPNREHGPALAHPSCAPPVQESDWLTTGTADSNGQATGFTGSMRFRTVVGNPSTPADEADVTTVLNIADVRNKADLTDYTGEVEATAMLRITDRFNHVTPGGGSDPATMVDIPFPVRASCAATADPAVGGTCTASTSVDAVVPGAVKEHQRAIWALDAVEVYDGGADGDTATTPNTLFARQGVFVP